MLFQLAVLKEVLADFLVFDNDIVEFASGSDFQHLGLVLVLWRD